jgi:hypothetical protein
MSRGHNFTRCKYCNLEYVCGDCITTDCEFGHNRKTCESYQAHIRDQKSSAERMGKLASTATGKQRAMAVLLGGLAWDTIAESLSNAELAEELKIKVWANQKFGTLEIALLEQAIERLLSH